MSILDYRRPDAVRLAPDESVVWSGTYSGRSRRGLYVKHFVVSTLSLAAVVGLIVAMHSGVSSAVPVVYVACGLLVPVYLLSLRDACIARPDPVRVGLTDQRMIACRTRQGELVGGSVQLGHADLMHFECSIPTAHDQGVLIVTGDVGESDDLDPEYVASRQIAIDVDNTEEAMRLVYLFGGSGVASRGRHGMSRTAPPAKTGEAVNTPDPLRAVACFADAPSLVTTALIPGETLLWTGCPAFDRRVDAIARWKAILRSLPLATISMALIVCVRPWQPPIAGWASAIVIVAICVLWFGIYSHIWSPLVTRARLRRTRYVVTTHRIVVHELAPSVSLTRVSFYDAATTVNLGLYPDGRGNVTVGSYGAFKLERIPQAAQVYQQIEYALASWRDAGRVTAAQVMDEQKSISQPSDSPSMSTQERTESPGS